MKATTFVTENGIVYNLLVDYRREPMGHILTKHIQPEQIKQSLEYYGVHIKALEKYDSIVPYGDIIDKIREADMNESDSLKQQDSLIGLEKALLLENSHKTICIVPWLSDALVMKAIDPSSVWIATNWEKTLLNNSVGESLCRRNVRFYPHADGNQSVLRTVCSLSKQGAKVAIENYRNFPNLSDVTSSVFDQNFFGSSNTEEYVTIGALALNLLELGYSLDNIASLLKHKNNSFFQINKL